MAIKVPPKPPQAGWAGPAPTPVSPMVIPALMRPVPLGPPSPTLFQRRWPRRTPAAATAALAGGLVTAIVAAAAVPLDRPGLGWPIAGLAMLVSLGVVLWKGGTGRVESFAWCAAALALLSVGAFRAAGWLFFLCLMAAFGCVALAVGRGRRVPALFIALINVPLAGFRALPWVAAGMSRLKGTGNNVVRLAASAGLGVLLLVVFGALFASADVAFDRIVDQVVPEFSAGTVVRWIFVGTVAAWLLFGAAYLVDSPSAVGDREPGEPRTVRRVEWLVPVGALLVMFVAFVAVQLTVLYGDRGYVMKTVGLTFAEYARKGFWQLLVVTLLTLVVMAVTVRKAPRGTVTDRILLRVVLGLLAACTLVIVGSAVKRMDVYEEAYGYTRLRVFVTAFELWLGALFVLVMIGGLARRARWLPRVAVALWVVTLLGLAGLNPDRFIAAGNVQRVAANNADVWYLSTLSADAVPELRKLPAGARECALSAISRDLYYDRDDWRGWNLAREQAREVAPRPVDVGDYPCYRRY
ncbi:DUF4153 domain-containing protein [Dactylosporangium sucinum]|uniref:DUF4153 domain-containing protein n=1 Tax=Dactylosporangium sucinum TaxID=1424081 RepID=UPI00167EA76E|nr:DUF4173 domain-containing protein [Dactylosporangium sucinum]